MSRKVAVVGAGISGLVCAYRLQQAGYDVSVFESEPFVGGRMSTRFKDGLAFDIGANFFVGHYQKTRAMFEELEIADKWKSMDPGAKFYLYSKGKLHDFSMSTLYSVFNFGALSFWSQAKLAKMILCLWGKIKDLDFFDLSNVPEELNTTNAYDYVFANAGQEVADRIVDAFTSTYQFHRAKEISISAMLSLLGLIVNQNKGFARCHAYDRQMITLPEELAGRLNVQTLCRVSGAIRFSSSSRISLVYEENVSGKHIDYFGSVVFACTADVARKMPTSFSERQAEFLRGVEYAKTLNVSFRVPVGAMGDVYCVTVPFVESPIIAEYTNEEWKGVVSEDESGRHTLVNVGLHESHAEMMCGQDSIYTDEKVFQVVLEELLRVCPPLSALADKGRISPHMLVRWPHAMPKFSKEHIPRVNRFWREGQGDNDFWLCGDYLNAPWVEGSIGCGQKVARMIIQKYSEQQEGAGTNGQ